MSRFRLDGRLALLLPTARLPPFGFQRLSLHPQKSTKERPKIAEAAPAYFLRSDEKHSMFVAILVEQVSTLQEYQGPKHSLCNTAGSSTFEFFDGPLLAVK